MKTYPTHNIKVLKFCEENGFYTTAERSKQMAKIKSKDTKAELVFRKKLWSLGYRYRKNVKNLPGSPDLLFQKYKLVVFIDGGFWHGYDWQQKKQKLKTNRRFWLAKIERNMQRDIQNNVALGKMGYEVFRFWDRDIKKELDLCIQEVVNYIESKKLLTNS